MILTLTGKVTSVSAGDCYVDGKPRVSLRIAEADSINGSILLPWDGELPELGTLFGFVELSIRQSQLIRDALERSEVSSLADVGEVASLVPTEAI